MSNDYILMNILICFGFIFFLNKGRGPLEIDGFPNIYFHTHM